VVPVSNLHAVEHTAAPTAAHRVGWIASGYLDRAVGYDPEGLAEAVLNDPAAGLLAVGVHSARVVRTAAPRLGAAAAALGLAYRLGRRRA
jgi:hypothetical protein